LGSIGLRAGQDLFSLADGIVRLTLCADLASIVASGRGRTRAAQHYDDREQAGEQSEPEPDEGKYNCAAHGYPFLLAAQP